MTYDEIRLHVQEHFRELLLQFKEQVATDGPPDAFRIDALRATESLAGGGASTWLATTYPGGAAALLSDFCDRRGIAGADLTEANRQWLIEALQAGHASVIAATLNHVSSLAHIDLSDPVPIASAGDAPTLQDTAAGKSVAEVATSYFDEIKRTKPLAVKTELDRKEALALLDEVTRQKPIAAVSKSDAQKVKQVLLRLPKNRSKVAATRGKMNRPGFTGG